MKQTYFVFWLGGFVIGCASASLIIFKSGTRVYHAWITIPDGARTWGALFVGVVITIVGVLGSRTR